MERFMTYELDISLIPAVSDKKLNLQANTSVLKVPPIHFS